MFRPLCCTDFTETVLFEMTQWDKVSETSATAYFLVSPAPQALPEDNTTAVQKDCQSLSKIKP